MPIERTGTSVTDRIRITDRILMLLVRVLVAISLVLTLSIGAGIVAADSGSSQCVNGIDATQGHQADTATGASLEGVQTAFTACGAPIQS